MELKSKVVCEGGKQTKIKIDLFLQLRSKSVHSLRTAWFCFIVFHFSGLRKGHGTMAFLLGTLVSAPSLYCMQFERF